MRRTIPITPEWVLENNCAWAAYYERVRYCPDLRQLVPLIYSFLNSTFSKDIHHQKVNLVCRFSMQRSCESLTQKYGSHVIGLLDCHSAHECGFSEKIIDELCFVDILLDFKNRYAMNSEKTKCASHNYITNMVYLICLN